LNLKSLFEEKSYLKLDINSFSWFQNEFVNYNITKYDIKIIQNLVDINLMSKNSYIYKLYIKSRLNYQNNLFNSIQNNNFIDTEFFFNNDS
jgi:hypothetical protein